MPKIGESCVGPECRRSRWWGPWDVWPLTEAFPKKGPRNVHDDGLDLMTLGVWTPPKS